MSELLKREWLSFGAALLILLAVAAVSYRSATAARETLASVAHTGEVLKQIDGISAALARAVTARRAHIIAGDRSQLGDVPKLDASLRRALTAVRESLSDNPGQQGHLDALARAIDERLDSLDRSVERRDRTGAAAEDPGEIPLVTRVRTIREGMVAEANRLLSERSVRTRLQLSRSRLAGLVGLAISMGILAASFFRMRREIERRRRSEAALAREQAFLETIVESMPDMLIVKDKDLRVELINRAGEYQLACKRENILGKREQEVATRFQVSLELSPIPAELPQVSADRTLFQPFHRAGQENGPIEGTGIGLVVTKRLAEAMGGSVGFRSVPGEGSEFWLDLPAH